MVIGSAPRRRLATVILCLAMTLCGACAAQATSPPRLSVSAAILYAPDTGQTLDAVAAGRRLAIASTTKLMTALVVLQHIRRLSTVFTSPDYRAAAADSQIGLAPGERMSVHDLLIALMLPSADDAAEDLAYNVGHHSVARFVGMMNAQARRLHLRDTHYSTPIGVDTPGNHSSARDLAHLAQYDLTHSPFLARVVALTTADLTTGPVRHVVNRNDLVARYRWIDGVKTGHTAAAGYVLVAAGHRDGMRLISAVLGTDSEAARDADTLALLNYGFGAFAPVTPVRRGQLMARPAIADSSGKRAVVRAARGFHRIVARSASVQVRVEVPRQLRGPLPGQAVVGAAVVLVGGRVLARVPLVLARALPAVSGLTVAVRLITRPVSIVVIGVLTAALLALAGLARRRRREPQRGKLEAA
ncbi:MAG: D-alanyl-D-alanine carboxypeptidase [Solirubrobacterales bacterium]|nr:D-alanyl-D-alanine carboxypeptidase [Solirubrobacterales bacterium]